MGSLLEQISALVLSGNVRISDHGYDELTSDRISARDAVSGIRAATVVNEYLDYGKGPCVLALQRDRVGEPIHVVWGIPRGRKQPAVLITAYRPDPTIWQEDFLRRKT